MSDFTMYAGDTKALVVTVKDETGTVVDLTDATIVWSLAKSPRSTVLVSKQAGAGIVIETPASAGILTITMDAEDTADLEGRHYHEVEITDQQDRVSTVFTGHINIRPDLIPASS